MGGDRTKQVALRLPTRLLDRVDRFAESLRSAEAGAVITRADALRILVARGLDATPTEGPREASALDEHTVVFVARLLRLEARQQGGMSRQRAARVLSERGFSAGDVERVLGVLEHTHAREGLEGS